MKQQPEKPIGIVNIIYDIDDSLQHCNMLTNFFNQHRYIVQRFSTKNISQYAHVGNNLPTFLVGLGRAGDIVQNITRTDNKYAGGISIMAQPSVAQRLQQACRLKFRRNPAPKIPLLIIGGWGAIRQMHTFVSASECGIYNDVNLNNLNVVIYPEINTQNALTVAQDDILRFLNSTQQNCA